jgi:catechol 2,3-dioxygenase-like lactoylglutathione lyase family enzyme
MRVSFMAGLGPLVRDAEASLAFYRDLLGLPLVEGNGYAAADNWQGTRHFGQWSVADAAESIFGSREWPSDIPLPQANFEFDVESVEAVEAAARELVAAGHPLLVGPKVEPWGQTVVRLLGPEGLLITLSYTPWMHEEQPEDSSSA